jgi:hypothetical protein
VQEAAITVVPVVGFIDADGRVFGRVNLIDALVGVFVVLLVPVAYATYLLFRPPTPQITSVEFAQLTFIEDRAAQGSLLSGKLKVRGTGFRPVLRATIGGANTIAFIFEDPTSADVLFGDVPPGKHDLVLFDGVHEVARASGAVTIPEKSASGRTSVAVVGTFVDLDEATAASLKTGAKFPSNEPQAEILALGPVVEAGLPINNRVDVAVEGKRQRSALVAVRCEISADQPRECKSAGITVGPGLVYLVPGTTNLRLLIDAVVPASPPTSARLRVRLFGVPDAVSLVRAGDADLPHLSIDQRGAVVRTIGARREGTGELTVLLSQEAATVLASAARPETIASLDVTLTAGLDRARQGWRYRGDVVRVGGPLTFTTETYTLRGLVIGMEIDSAHAPGMH